MYLVLSFDKSLPWPIDIHGQKIYFYCNILLSQYCAQKCLAWIRPKKQKSFPCAFLHFVANSTLQFFYLHSNRQFVPGGKRKKSLLKWIPFRDKVQNMQQQQQQQKQPTNQQIVNFERCLEWLGGVKAWKEMKNSESFCLLNYFKLQTIC